MRNSNASQTPETKWAADTQLLLDAFASLSTGASWSGNERNHLFLGDAKTNEFIRVTGISGLDDPGDSRGFALIDIDRDGWLDVALLNLSAPRVRLLRNRIGERATSQGNGHIALRFVGGNQTAKPSRKWSSRDGFGCSVELKLTDGTRIYREHRTEDGFMTQHTQTMVIGIGAGRRVESVTVRWPSGRVQVIEGVARGALVTVHEDGNHRTESYSKSEQE